MGASRTPSPPRTLPTCRWGHGAMPPPGLFLFNDNNGQNYLRHFGFSIPSASCPGAAASGCVGCFTRPPCWHLRPSCCALSSASATTGTPVTPRAAPPPPPPPTDTPSLTVSAGDTPVPPPGHHRGANPAADTGNRYHYLPWYDAKPVVAVTSIWEDAGHRWDAANLLQNMAQRLVSTHGWGRRGASTQSRQFLGSGELHRREMWPRCGTRGQPPAGTPGGGCSGSWRGTAGEHPWVAHGSPRVQHP